MTFSFAARMGCAAFITIAIGSASVAGCAGKITEADVAPDGGVGGFDGGVSTVPPGDPPPIDPPPGPTDVVGSLFDGTGGRANNAVVEIDSALVPIDPWGRFVLRNAPPSYDLVVRSTGFGGSTTGYLGIASRTPSVNLTNSTEASYGLLNIVYSASSGTYVTFAIQPDGTMGLLPDVPNGAYVWFNDEAQSELMTLLSISYLPVNNAPPTTFPEFARQDNVLFQSGQTTTWTPTYNPIASSTTVTLTPIVPTGISIYDGYVMVNHGVGAPALINVWGYELPPGAASQSEWTFVVPQIDGLDFFVMFEAAGPDQQGSFGGPQARLTTPIATGGPLNPTIDLPPSQTSPDDSATFGVGTTFSWSNGARLCTIAFTPINAADPSFAFTTTSGSFTFPDLSALGTSLTSAAGYHWSVACGVPNEGSGDPVAPFLDPGGAAIAPLNGGMSSTRTVTAR